MQSRWKMAGSITPFIPCCFGSVSKLGFSSFGLFTLNLWLSAEKQSISTLCLSRHISKIRTTAHTQHTTWAQWERGKKIGKLLNKWLKLYNGFLFLCSCVRPLKRIELLHIHICFNGFSETAKNRLRFLFLFFDSFQYLLMPHYAKPLTNASTKVGTHRPKSTR